MFKDALGILDCTSRRIAVERPWCVLIVHRKKRDICGDPTIRGQILYRDLSAQFFFILSSADSADGLILAS
jgi:hypothetical protein